MAVTANQILTIKEPGGLLSVPVKTGETIYSGTLAGVGNDGLLYNITASNYNTIMLIGFVCDDSINASGNAAVTSSGSISGTIEGNSAIAGDKTVRNIWTKGFVKATFTSITQAMLGTTMYVKDNYTIDDTQTLGIPCGYLATYLSATSGYVALNEYNEGPGVRIIKGALVAITATTGGGLLSVINPTGKTCMIERMIVDITTPVTAATTADIGVAANGTTSSDTLIDACALNAATTKDNTVNGGTNGKGAAKWTSGQYVTGTTSAALTTGFVGTFAIHYRLWL